MKDNLQRQLPAMFDLARERTEGARVQLAGMLADLFLNDNVRLSLREEEMVNELIDQLMQTKSPVVRMQLLRKFSDLSQMPRKVAMNLACDTIETARDILVANQKLTDQDLIVIVSTQSADHACAVAQRHVISEAVADALVTTGDRRVMQIVAENLGAHLSPKAVEVMTEAAKFTSLLRAPIMKRPEMTAREATKLYWWVSSELRRYALKQFNLEAAQVDAALAQAVDKLLDDNRGHKNDDAVMGMVADWLGERQMITGKILTQVLRLQHYRLFNILLGRLARVPLPLVDAIVTETGGRGLAVICRAIGIEKAVFASLFLLVRGARPDEQIVHPKEMGQAFMAFERLTVDLAQDLLRSWEADPSYLEKRKQEDVMLEAG